MASIDRPLESDVQEAMADEVERQRLDLQLDQELQDTFPASDALKVNLRQPDRPAQHKAPDTVEV